MRLSRVFTPQILAVGDTVELEKLAAHYLARVLRVSVGDTVTLFNGDGEDYTGQVERIDRHRLWIRLTAKEAVNTESGLRIILVQAICRGERMDYAVQKATELGVDSIQPLFSSRVEVRLHGQRKDKRLAHWRGVAIAACEQSGRAVVPQVLESVSLNTWLAGEDGCQRLVLDPRAGLKLSTCTIEGGSVSLLVGPEGGFSSEELEQMTGQGVTAVSLGPRVLRTESAGPAAIAVLQALGGDF